MAYFNWNDSKILNIFSFSLPTRGGGGILPLMLSENPGDILRFFEAGIADETW